MAKTMQAWLESNQHLPKLLRDFHDQKRVFKWIGSMVDKAERPQDLPNWISAHIYTIDWFLRLMARHGYTLQPTAKKAGFEFADLDVTVKDF